MFSALQKVHPRLAALLGARDKGSSSSAARSRSERAADNGAGAALLKRQVDAAELETQRALKQFFEVVPERIRNIRALFAQVSAAPADGRHAVLEALCSQVRVVRSLCDVPGLESVYKITTALERLLRSLSDGPSFLTPSTLRTTASTLVLLETVCKPGLQGDLISNPAPRCLSIDDNPVCRRAISSALEHVFSPPDHAETGEAALGLIEKQPYDIIFLDVEMPGMNGFEVCARIHQTKSNSQTPVVFVTIHSDFESRAKASEASGHDFIAKPFLACELTLKTLTLLLRRRMQFPPPVAQTRKKP